MHLSPADFSQNFSRQIPVQAIGAKRSAVNSIFDAKLGIFESLGNIGGGKH